MTLQFCRVGRITPNLDKVLNLKTFEVLATSLVDDLDKLEFPEHFNFKTQTDQE
ncbi:hypothetical protein [Gaetbulibacter aestuarii]|uniref:Uncharacterized protein n=1 Tax=Gaetbulibacter aestuarii TaxID=1502358 RepID=A0ABW7MXP5_9FLAO